MCTWSCSVITSQKIRQIIHLIRPTLSLPHSSVITWTDCHHERWIAGDKQPGGMASGQTTVQSSSTTCSTTYNFIARTDTTNQPSHTQVVSSQSFHHQRVKLSMWQQLLLPEIATTVTTNRNWSVQFNSRAVCTSPTLSVVAIGACCTVIRSFI